MSSRAALDARSSTATLAQRYRSALKRYFERRLRDSSEAEDLAQEVLLRLTIRQSASQDGPPAETRTSYVFATARGVLTDKIRRDQVRARAAHCDLEDPAIKNDGDMEVPSAECVYSSQERIQRLAQLLEAMSPRAREVFTMHRIEGLPYSEIAAALGIAVSTVEKHMISALRLLMQHASELL